MMSVGVEMTSYLDTGSMVQKAGGCRRRAGERDIQLDDVSVPEHAHVFHLSLDSGFGFGSIDDLFGDVLHRDSMTGDGVDGL